MADEEAITPQDTMNVVDPFGKTGSLPKDQAQEAIETSGYRQATPDEALKQHNQDVYGGFQGQVFAGVLGAARGATLGGSDWVLSHLPGEAKFSPELINNLKEANPTITTLGELGGILEDPASIGKYINKAGKATERGVSSAIEAARIASDSPKVLSTLSGAAGMAAEGALFTGVSNTINDYTLGDPSLNGEKVLMNIGLGAMVGGATGGAFKLFGAGITPTIRKAMGGLADIRDDLIGSGYGEKSLISKVLPERFSQAIADRQLNLNTDGQASFLRKMADNLNSVTGSIQDEINQFGSDIHWKAVKAQMKSAAKDPAVDAAFEDGIKEISSEFDQIKKDVPGLENETIRPSRAETVSGKYDSALRKMAEMNKSLGNRFNPITNPDNPVIAAYQKIKDFIQNPNIFGASGAGYALHEEQVASFRKFISDSDKLTPFQETFGEVKGGKWGFDLEKIHEAIKGENLDNIKQLDDYFAALKEMPENLLNARRAVPNSSWKKDTLNQIIANANKTNSESYQDYLNGISKRRPVWGWKDYAPVLIAKWHPVVAAAIEAYDMYQDPVHATHELALVERMLATSTKKTLDAIDHIFTPGNVTKGLVEGNKETENENDKKKFRDAMAGLNEASNNIQTQTKPLYDSAPNIAGHLNLAASNATSFLNSKLPQTETGDFFGGKIVPSKTDIAAFEHYRKIVEDPTRALKEVANGGLRSETLETLSMVYPKLYDHMKQQLVQRIALEKAKNKLIPYQTRLALSTFLGAPTDPQSFFLNQQAMQTSTRQNQMPPSGGKSKPSSGGLSKLKLSERIHNSYSTVDG